LEQNNSFLLFQGKRTEEHSLILKETLVSDKDIKRNIAQQLSNQSFFMILSGKVFIEYENRPSNTLEHYQLSEKWNECVDVFHKDSRIRATGYRDTTILKLDFKDETRLFNDICSVKGRVVKNTNFNYNLESNSMAIVYSANNYNLNGMEIDGNTVTHLHSGAYNSLELITSNTCYVISVAQK
jgi:hypothetical protein